MITSTLCECISVMIDRSAMQEILLFVFLLVKNKNKDTGSERYADVCSGTEHQISRRVVVNYY